MIVRAVRILLNAFLYTISLFTQQSAKTYQHLRINSIIYCKLAICKSVQKLQRCDLRQMKCAPVRNLFGSTPVLKWTMITTFYYSVWLKGNNWIEKTYNVPNSFWIIMPSSVPDISVDTGVVELLRFPNKCHSSVNFGLLCNKTDCLDHLDIKTTRRTTYAN